MQNSCAQTFSKTLNSKTTIYRPQSHPQNQFTRPAIIRKLQTAPVTIVYYYPKSLIEGTYGWSIKVGQVAADQLIDGPLREV